MRLANSEAQLAPSLVQTTQALRKESACFINDIRNEAMNELRQTIRLVSNREHINNNAGSDKIIAACKCH